MCFRCWDGNAKVTHISILHVYFVRRWAAVAFLLQECLSNNYLGKMQWMALAFHYIVSWDCMKGDDILPIIRNIYIFLTIFYSLYNYVLIYILWCGILYSRKKTCKAVFLWNATILVIQIIRKHNCLRIYTVYYIIITKDCTWRGNSDKMDT